MSRRLVHFQSSCSAICPGFEEDVTQLRENSLGLSISTQMPLFKGGFTLQGVGTSTDYRNGAASGTLTYSIPEGATLCRAILWWNKFSTASPGSSVTINGTAFTGDLVGRSGDTCWNTGAKNIVFRRDVSDLITQLSGSLAITGFPNVRDGNMMVDSSQGAALLLIYSSPEGTCTKIDVYDGCVSLADGGTQSYSLALQGAKASQIGLGVGDGQDFFSDDFRLSGVTIPGSQAYGRDGPFMDAFAVPVEGLGAIAPLTLSTQTFSDCLSWFLAVHGQ